ncbi:MAG: hypothetical protein U0V18_15070 [Anaerolineales bacterium]
MLRSITLPWLSWMLVTIIGSILGEYFSNVISGWFFPDLHFLKQQILSLLTRIAVHGLVIAFFQWVIILSKLKKSWIWIPATSIGLPLGAIIGFWVNDFFARYVFSWLFPSITYPSDAGTFAVVIGAGMFAGWLQCAVTNRKLRESLIWAIVSGLCWTIAVNPITVIYIKKLNLYFIPYTQGILIGASIGIISGAFFKSTFMNLESESKMFK